jgi:hypothetical protein
MRNYSQASVTSKEVFRNPSYDVALAWARTEQKVAPANVSYTIDKDEKEGGIVSKNEGWLGGNPPTQPIISDFKD